jgi:hypothetical protein
MTHKNLNDQTKKIGILKIIYINNKTSVLDKYKTKEIKILHKYHITYSKEGFQFDLQPVPYFLGCSSYLNGEQFYR